MKLGGSLLTEKAKEATARHATIRRVAAEIAKAHREDPTLQLLLGHGSGSFGHQAAAKHGTRLGARSAQDWAGFAAVWHAAIQLNRLLLDELIQAGLPAVGFAPSASAICSNGALRSMAVEPIERALHAGLLPVVHGDVAFDRKQGATILSTEQVLSHLAFPLKPTHLLLAGRDPGVYADYPATENVLERISEEDLARHPLEGSEATDVTGGMAEKVREALALSRRLPDLEIRIFSAEEPGSLKQALAGKPLGTLVRSRNAAHPAELE